MVEKARAQTLQQRFGFQDKELTTPAHDAIMMWLNENINQVCQVVLGGRHAWSDHDIKWADSVVRNRSFGRIASAVLPDYPEDPIKVQRVEWEFPIMSGSYMVGFVDMRAEVRLPCLVLEDSSTTIKASTTTVTLLFEIKPSIPSLGELIRQIQMYKTYQEGWYIVVSPDARWVPILNAQKIYFVTCPEM